MTDRQSAGDIAAQAARWAWIADREEDDVATRSALDAWLAGDPRRRGALLQAEAALAAIELRPEAANDARFTVSRRAALIGGASALVASAAAVFVAWPRSATIETATGEIRNLTLEDRSGVVVNTDSRLRARFHHDVRNIQVARGEAWFRVRKDKTRPFVVAAGAVRVQAVGTAFAVRLTDKGANVLITEGRVRVWIEGDEVNARFVSAGSALAVRDGAFVPLVADDPAAVARTLAWRTHRLELAGQTLGEAVAEINRYNTRQITVAPEAIGLRLFGAFGVDDPETFARTAAVTLGLKLDDNNGGLAIGPAEHVR